MLDKVYEGVPKGRLTQPVAHRWVSAAMTMERYLVFHPDLVAFFAQKEGGRQLAMKEKQEVGLMRE